MERKPCPVRIVEGDAAGSADSRIIEYHHRTPHHGLGIVGAWPEIPNEGINLVRTAGDSVQATPAAVAKVINHHISAALGCYFHHG
jgi:hypothetical protein